MCTYMYTFVVCIRMYIYTCMYTHKEKSHTQVHDVGKQTGCMLHQISKCLCKILSHLVLTRNSKCYMHVRICTCVSHFLKTTGRFINISQNYDNNIEICT